MENAVQFVVGKLEDVLVHLPVTRGLHQESPILQRLSCSPSSLGVSGPPRTTVVMTGPRTIAIILLLDLGQVGVYYMQSVVEACWVVQVDMHSLQLVVYCVSKFLQATHNSRSAQKPSLSASLRVGCGHDRSGA